MPQAIAASTSPSWGRFLLPATSCRCSLSLKLVEPAKFHGPRNVASPAVAARPVGTLRAGLAGRALRLRPSTIPPARTDEPKIEGLSDIPGQCGAPAIVLASITM
jgi:hypothetical protein